MTVEQVKAEEKKRSGRELTSEQAQVLLETNGGELTEEELGKVSGGATHKSPRL